MKMNTLTLHVLASQAIMFGLGGYSSYSLAAADDSMDMLDLSEAPLSEQQLDTQRGGFIDKSGMKIQIGLEKVTLIDGMVAARSRLVIPDINAHEKIDQAMVEMDQKMAVSFEAMNQLLDRPDGLKARELSADEKKIVSMAADNFRYLQGATSSVSAQPQGTKVSVESNAQTGVRTDTATLSMAKVTQASSPSSAAPATLTGPTDITKAVEKVSTSAASAEKLSTVERAMAMQSAQSSVNSPLTQVKQLSNGTTLIQNSANNRLIQTFQVVNIELSNFSQFRNQNISARLLPQLLQYSR